MSDSIFWLDSDEEPRSREDTRIAALIVEPYPDGRRVRLALNITPFIERPNLEIYARKIDGPLVAEMSIIETMTPRLEFTLHIRGLQDTSGDYLVRVELFYDERTQPQDIREITFNIPAPNTREIDTRPQA